MRLAPISAVILCGVACIPSCNAPAGRQGTVEVVAHDARSELVVTSSGPAAIEPARTRVEAGPGGEAAGVRTGDVAAVKTGDVSALRSDRTSTQTIHYDTDVWLNRAAVLVSFALTAATAAFARWQALKHGYWTQRSQRLKNEGS